MHEVFLSYAHEDREIARRLVALLEERGYSVWWDPDLVPSRNYLREIDGVLRDAKCVVVLWTRASVASDFVLEEASIAREQGKLVGVLLEDVERPVSFRLVHAADLQGWEGDPDHAGIQRLDAGIRACLGTPPSVPSRLKRRWIRWLALPVPTLINAVIVLVLWGWPWATAVEADVVTKRVRFRTGDAASQTLFEAMPIRSLAVRGFLEMRLPGEDGPPVLRPSGTDPARVSIRPADTRETLSIDGVAARSAEVTLDAPEQGSIGVTVRGQKVNAGVSLPPEVVVIATGCATGGDQPSVTFRKRVAPSDRLMEFSSGDGPLRLVLGLVRPALKPALTGGKFEFEDVESTIISGTLRFPDLGRSENLNEKDYLRLDEAHPYEIRGVDLLDAGSLRVRLRGVAGSLAYGSKRERFTMLSLLSAHPVLAGALAVVVWLIPQWWAWRRFGRAVR